MIKDNQKYLNRLHLVMDATLTALAYMLAWWLKFESVFATKDPNVYALPMETYFRALYVLVPAYLILYYSFGLYNSQRVSRSWDDFANIVKSNVAGFLGIFVTLYILKQINFSRTMIGIFVVINVIQLMISRMAVRSILRYFRKRGYNIKHVLLVGYSRAAESYIMRIDSNPQWGYDCVGVLDDQVPLGTSYHGVKVVGKIDELQDYLDRNEFDEITITLPLNAYDRLEELVSKCEKTGIHTKFIPDYTSLFPSNPYTEDIAGLPVISIRYVALTNTLNRAIKRLIDIVGALCALIIFAIPMGIIAIAVKATSKGPVIFKQERIGRHGTPFMMYKFRTMAVQDKRTEDGGWTTPDDPRVTKVGRFLRRTSLDETPQFLNIFLGQMSLVGPRPERPNFVEKFRDEEQIPRYMVRHQVRPGLTGWAQINGYRGDTSIRKRIDYDIYYIENWSLKFDIKILFLTMFKGFINKNAY
ncbi:MAG: undecaprenyl-phosphate glucose phosphotransferase [Lachnospiraceae bacterium]|nr:undecaprenyl-phosphate glucose phosphotransferase [Lachnospiraceae bacterium]